MRPLFLKILALLLGSFVVVVVFSFFLFQWVNEELDPGGARMRGLVHETAEELVESYLKGDVDQARHRLRQHRIRAWIETASGRPLSDPPAPPEVRRQVQTFPQVVYPFQNPAGRFFIFAQPVHEDGDTYHVIMTADRSGFHGRNRWGFFWVPLAALVAGLLVASAALSYWILRPLRAFRSTARAISADNLHARLPKSITARRDAFGDLAREFNGMTDRLEQSVENQNQLLRDVSHELRSPLARIQVAASLWARRTGHQEAYDRIENEVGRLDRLIGDLLSLSRIKSGGGHSPVAFDLVGLLKTVADDAAFEFSPLDKRTRLDVPDSAPFVGDPAMITSAVENVVRNALRHSPDGEYVDIHLEKTAVAYRITIRDQGPGVDAAKLDRIFDPFFQANEARSVGSGHHGIGLSLARAVIDLHRGKILAMNAEGPGLIVEIELPLTGQGLGQIG